MSYDFKGTFNRSQVERFFSFARQQVPVIQARKNHLSAEISRTGRILFSYDPAGTPVGFNVSPSQSYIGKLVSVYEILGGSVLYDLHVRSRSQAVFLVKGDDAVPAQLMSNGEIQGLPGQADGLSSEIMELARSWVQDTITYRFESLERKIRRSLDYSDQLRVEAQFLTVIMSGQGTPDSLEFLINQVETLFSDPSYRAVWDDISQGKADPFNRFGFAPFLPFSSGPDRNPSEVYGRDTTGPTAPGVKE